MGIVINFDWVEPASTSDLDLIAQERHIEFTVSCILYLKCCSLESVETNNSQMFYSLVGGQIQYFWVTGPK